MNYYQEFRHSLNSHLVPYITSYELGCIIFTISNQTKRLAVSSHTYKEIFGSCLSDAIRDGFLIEYSKKAPGKAYLIFGKDHSDPHPLVCILDPFAFLSHLSAMSYYGLTNRNPTTIFISSPRLEEWNHFATAKMKKDLGEQFQEYMESGLPQLKQHRFDRIHKRSVNVFRSVHRGAFKTFRDSGIRVSTLGRTFLEMLQQPDLCGGMNHVLDVWQEHGETYRKLIVNEVEQHGKPIDKVRAGYLLEERCGINHPAIDSWKQFAKRGGSRKLDPSADYHHEFSETWMLSINV